MCTYSSVLLIDDNEIDNFVNRKLVERTQLIDNVYTVQSAYEGLKYLEFSQGAPENLPEWIFLDINMPQMNGFEFLEAFAQQFGTAVRERCRIVMLSSSIDNGDRQRAVANPLVAHFLTKPLSLDKLAKLMGGQPVVVG
ncbi:MAG: response regulator [Catalinimonas sp.]